MDWQKLAADSVTALVPVLTVVVVWGARLLIPKIPRAVLPLLALGAGPILDAILGALSGVQAGGMVQAALLGAAGVWLREFFTTIKQHGLSA